MPRIDTAATPTIDEAKFQAFVERFFADLGAVMHATTVLIGDRVGLYKAMADCAWHTPEQLAEVSGTDPRYVREWLAAQAASGYADYDPTSGRFRLTPEQALALTSEDGPIYAPAGLQAAAGIIADLDRLTDAFRSAQGIAYGEHHPDLADGTLRFFRTNYLSHLTQYWLPALDGVEDRLRAGTSVADIGCGGGASTIIMANAYPASRFYGFDSDERSIATARTAAAEAGVAERCTFQVATAKEYPGTGYALVTAFDALHDMGDPTGAAAHVLDTLTPDGTFMIVEPFASDRLEDNLTPIGRIFYAASTTICLPMSRAQEVDAGLGGQAGEARLREVVTAGGFSRFRRAAQTPFNLVFEARP